MFKNSVLNISHVMIFAICMW